MRNNPLNKTKVGDSTVLSATSTSATDLPIQATTSLEEGGATSSTAPTPGREPTTAGATAAVDTTPLPDDTELPAGWTAHIHESGTYYEHAASGATQWERPQADLPPGGNVEHAHTESDVSGEAGAQQSSPAQQGRRQAKRTATHTKHVTTEGHAYYSDVVTSETSWAHPGEHAVIE